MAKEITVSDIVTKFLLNTTRLCPQPSYYTQKALHYCTCAITSGVSNPYAEICSVPSGSCMEFYIEPMLSCVGDRDIMYFNISQLAVPKEYQMPSKLPPEFHTFARVYKIVDSGFPGYVYLLFSHDLLEGEDEGIFKMVECDSKFYLQNNCTEIDNTPNMNITHHGPAITMEADAFTIKQGLITQTWSVDYVQCLRCLAWPPQAAHWPERLRPYGWPDSTTVNGVVCNGCDVVPVAHPLCRQDEWMSTYQWRLSFSRAETVLLNSWMPIQQIIYHMLRVFVKTERFTESADNSDSNKLSNYNTKTLMLWSTERRPSTWWSDGPNLVRICVKLLHELSTQMTDKRCDHYFLDAGNLFPAERNSDEFLVVAALLASVTEASLAQWFLDNYIRRCCQELDTCKMVAPLFNNVSNCVELDAAVSELISWKLHNLPVEIFATFEADQLVITRVIGRWFFNVRSVVNFISRHKLVDHRLFVYASASAFLHAAFEIQRSGIGGDFDNYVEVLAAVSQCFSQSRPPTVTNNRRRFLSKNLLRKAIEILKSVVSRSLDTLQLIEVELAKAYLHKTLRCKDADSDSIFCLANVYLAVLYYAAGHYQTAIYHCTLVTRSQDHSQCSSHVIRGELLLKIDDDIDSILGLAVFYQYIRRAVLDERQTEHVSVFTTELFAQYLRIICYFAANFAENSSISANILPDFRYYTERYVVSNSTVDARISDVLLLKTVLKEVRQIKNVGLIGEKYCCQETSETGLQRVQDTSKLVELLQQCAVELLTWFRQRQSQDFGRCLVPVTDDFEALYAFHRGHYRRCICICKDIVDRLYGRKTSKVKLKLYPEFMQLMDDDIVSLFGVLLLLKPTIREDEEEHTCTLISQLAMALYLLAQSQIKLNYFPLSLYDTNLCTQIAQLITKQRHPDLVLEQSVLKLTERRITMYRQMCISQGKSVGEYDRQSVEEFVQVAKVSATTRITSV